VVTLAEVENTLATEFGRTLARLLNCGFTLRSALSILTQTRGVKKFADPFDNLMETAYRYTVLGDGG
jgi:type II secretory pathway component PulF